MADFRKFLTGAGVKEIVRRWEILRRAVRVLDLELLCRFWRLEKLVGEGDEALRSELAGKQDKLTAGENITIEGDVISAPGVETRAEADERYEKLVADIKDLAQAIADMGGSVPYLRVLPEEAQWVSEVKGADYTVLSNTEWKAD